MCSHRRYLLSAMIVFLCVPIGVRADDIDARLWRRVDIDKTINAPFKDVLQFLTDRFDLKVQFDGDAFVAEKREILNRKLVTLPKAPKVSMDTILRLELAQIGAVYEMRKGAITIVPDVINGQPRPFPNFTDTQKQARKELGERLAKQQVEFSTDVNARAADILEFLTESHDTLVMFDLAQKGKAAGKRVQFKKGKYTMEEVLKEVAKVAGAKYEVHPDHVRVIPDE